MEADLFRIVESAAPQVGKPDFEGCLVFAEQVRIEAADAIANEARVKQREVMGGRHAAGE